MCETKQYRHNVLVIVIFIFIFIFYSVKQNVVIIMMNQSCITLASIFSISPLCRAISQYLWPTLALENTT